MFCKWRPGCLWEQSSHDSNHANGRGKNEHQRKTGRSTRKISSGYSRLRLQNLKQLEIKSFCVGSMQYAKFWIELHVSCKVSQLTKTNNNNNKKGWLHTKCELLTLESEAGHGKKPILGGWWSLVFGLYRHSPTLDIYANPQIKQQQQQQNSMQKKL